MAQKQIYASHCQEKKYFLIEKKSKPKIWMMLLNFGQSFGDVLEKKVK